MFSAPAALFLSVASVAVRSACSVTCSPARACRRPGAPPALRLFGKLPRSLRIILAVVLLSLGGCGLKGPLHLPAPEEPQEAGRVIILSYAPALVPAPALAPK